MEDKIEKMNQEKEAAVKVQKFEKAAKIRDEVNKLKEELEVYGLDPAMAK